MKRYGIPTLVAILALPVAVVCGTLPAGAQGRPAGLLGLKFTPSHVRGGGTIKLRIALSSPAPAGGVTVTISDSDPKVLPLPKTITIPAGARRLGLTITTAAVTSKTEVKLSASYSGVARNEKVAIEP